MKKYNLIKAGSSLIIASMLLISISAVTSEPINKGDISVMSPDSGFEDRDFNLGSANSPIILWDNGMHHEGLGASQYDFNMSFDPIMADDFWFDEDQIVADVHWVGGYWNGPPFDGEFHWEIVFYNVVGDGSKPGSIITSFFFVNTSVQKTYIDNTGSTYYYNYSVYLPEPVEFSANTKYWISIQGIGLYPPQSGWAFHYLPITLHESKFKSGYFGFPIWTDSDLVFGSAVDTAFMLTGLPPDELPPRTVCELEGTMEETYFIGPVTVHLNATDDLSGVNYTMYKVDDKSWQEYEDPFVVSESGEHTIRYFSVDNANNIEEEQSCTFTIKICCFDIEIPKGFSIGLKANIAETCNQSHTAVPWKFNISYGRILIPLSPIEGTVDILAGSNVQIKVPFLLGLGRFLVKLTVDDCDDVAASAIIIGPFVIIE